MSLAVTWLSAGMGDVVVAGSNGHVVCGVLEVAVGTIGIQVASPCRADFVFPQQKRLNHPRNSFCWTSSTVTLLTAGSMESAPAARLTTCPRRTCTGDAIQWLIWELRFPPMASGHQWKRRPGSYGAFNSRAFALDISSPNNSL